MMKCWGEPGATRKKPHEVMRDAKRILSDVFNTRQIRSYAAVFPKLFNDIEIENTDAEALYHTSGESRHSSVTTDNTTVTLDDLSNCERNTRSHFGTGR